MPPFRRVWLFSLALLAGCGSTAPPPPKLPAQPATGAGESETDKKVRAELAKLAPADRQAAEAQKLCPVSGEPLGSMGAPPKLDVKGQTVFVCCAGCSDTVREEPDKFLAKLKPADSK